ncbi:MAG: hypothetical protein ACREKE_03050 [bacterium]
MDAFERLDPLLRQIYADGNPWDLAYDPSPRDVKTALENMRGAQVEGDRQALQRLEKDLRGFPPNERVFELGQDLSNGMVSVNVLTWPDNRIGLTAEYRLIPEECAVVHLKAGGLESSTQGVVS